MPGAPEKGVRGPCPVGSKEGAVTPPLTTDHYPLTTELLDPAAWQAGLEKYALAMHLAVALVDE